MEILDIDRALVQMSQLLEMAYNGTEIIITKNNQPMVKLVSLHPPQKRPPLFGSDKDVISIADDFDEPLEEFNDYL